ncbi:uncharacterized protein LOC117123335 [Anneissia japonica]|uniref:uncharacterized protein LOC117123335 n=1 Tax=Anneissia japonica TaxID=1529436 RepID=UPI0014259177|nr:uncharacterized protein LOC117123335 [Anneissia japonica]
MLRINVGLLLLIFVSYIVFSEQTGSCDIKDIKRLKTPPIIQNQTSHVNSSLDFRTCGPSGSPDIIYKMIPDRITSKVRFIDIELSFMALADADGGYLDANVVYEPDNIQMKYSTGFDCGLMESNLKCPLPIKRKVN